MEDSSLKKFHQNLFKYYKDFQKKINKKYYSDPMDFSSYQKKYEANFLMNLTIIMLIKIFISYVIISEMALFNLCLLLLILSFCMYSVLNNKLLIAKYILFILCFFGPLYDYFANTNSGIYMLPLLITMISLLMLMITKSIMVTSASF